MKPRLLPALRSHWPLWREALAGLALGGLHAQAFAPAVLWWLQLACVAGLAWRAAQLASPRAAAVLGWSFGTGWLVGGVWWLFISMHTYGHLPAWMAALAVLLLAGFLALYLAAALGLFVRLRSGRPWRDAALFAALWLLAELARGLVFTGFPWVAAGYAHTEGPLQWLAPWVGVYGMGAAAAWLSVLFATPGWRGRSAAVGVLAALALLPVAPFTRPTGTLSLSLIQGNVPQDEKFSADHLPDTLVWHGRTLLAARGDLVVGPETVIPLLPDQLPPDYWEMLVQHFQRGSTAALLGVPLGSFQAGYTNSAVGLSRDNPSATEVYRYDKHHLVPFGEFIPLGFRWFVDLMQMPLGDFNRGTPNAPSFTVKGERVAPNICYEDLFGEELAARFVDAARAPTVFANLSNIAWFGESVAVDQHLQISRLRALEFQVPMIRATNTGATVVIDRTGRVTHALPPHTRGVLEAQVQGASGVTPYAWWAGRLALWPLAVLAAAMVAWAWQAGRRAAAAP